MAARKGKSFLSRAWKWTCRIFLFLFISHLLYIFLLKWIDPPITITQLNSWMEGNGLKRDYVDGEEISRHLKLAVIAAEDQKYPEHDGFDWKSIERAMAHNEKKPKRVRGASTISQQVAKNVFLWQGRSWLRKGVETYFTKMIEWIWGKERILEVYLNVAEMGKGIFGAQAAAKFYFNKDARSLTRREASLIAACLPNPKLYKVNPPSVYVINRSGWIIRQMGNLEGRAGIKSLVEPVSGK